MKTAIDVLKKSIDAVKSEVMQAKAQLDEAQAVVRSKEKVIIQLVQRVDEMEAGLALIESGGKKVSKKNV